MTLLASLHVTDSVQRAFDRFFAYLPNILGFVVILVVGWLIARLVRTVLLKLAGRANVDRRVAATPAGELATRVSPGGSPSRLVAGIVYWLILIYVVTAAVGELAIPSVTAFMNTVLGYLPNVIAAVVIFLVAVAVSAGVVALARRAMGATPTSRLVETVAPGVIMAVAVFMILTQLRIAPTIVIITYAALLGMLALAGGLAFGLGGRDVAAQLWSSAYEQGRETSRRAQMDLEQGRNRRRAEEEAARREAEREARAAAEREAREAAEREAREAAEMEAAETARREAAAREAAARQAAARDEALRQDPTTQLRTPPTAPLRPKSPRAPGARPSGQPNPPEVG